MAAAEIDVSPIRARIVKKLRIRAMVIHSSVVLACGLRPHSIPVPLQVEESPALVVGSIQADHMQESDLLLTIFPVRVTL